MRSLRLSMTSLVSRDRAEACQRPGGTGHDVQGTATAWEVLTAAESITLLGLERSCRMWPVFWMDLLVDLHSWPQNLRVCSGVRPGEVLQYCKKSPVLDLKSVNEYKPRVFLQHPSGRSSSCGQTKLVMHANITRHKPASRVTRRHRPDALGGRTAVSSIR